MYGKTTDPLKFGFVFVFDAKMTVFDVLSHFCFLFETIIFLLLLLKKIWLKTVFDQMARLTSTTRSNPRSAFAFVVKAACKLRVLLTAVNASPVGDLHCVQCVRFQCHFGHYETVPYCDALQITVIIVTVRDTFCSYGVMELCTRGLGTSISALRSRNVNLSSVRILCVVAEERPRIQLTQSFSKLFSALGLSPRVVSTSFGCRVDTGICLQVCLPLHSSDCSIALIHFSSGEGPCRSGPYVQATNFDGVFLLVAFHSSTSVCLADTQCVGSELLAGLQWDFTRRFIFCGSYKTIDQRILTKGCIAPSPVRKLKFKSHH